MVSDISIIAYLLQTGDFGFNLDNILAESLGFFGAIEVLIDPHLQLLDRLYHYDTSGEGFALLFMRDVPIVLTRCFYLTRRLNEVVQNYVEQDDRVLSCTPQGALSPKRLDIY